MQRLGELDTLHQWVTCRGWTVVSLMNGSYLTHTTHSLHTNLDREERQEEVLLAVARDVCIQALGHVLHTDVQECASILEGKRERVRIGWVSRVC